MNIQAVSGAEPINTNFSNTKMLKFQGNLLKNGTDILDIGITKKFENGISKLITRAKDFINQTICKGQLEPTDTPVIAEMSRKGWYRDAGEKLNDIYLDLKSNDQYTGLVKDNIESYNKLPKVIKEALKPEDVDYYGHISQYQVNQLYEIAKGAKRIPADSYPPSFKGNTTEEMLKNALNSDSYGTPLNVDDIGKTDLISDIKVDSLHEGIASAATNSKAIGMDDSLLEGTDLKNITSNLHEHLSENLHEGFDTSSLVEAAKEHAADLGEAIAEFAKSLIGHS